MLTGNNLSFSLVKSILGWVLFFYTSSAFSQVISPYHSDTSSNVIDTIRPVVSDSSVLIILDSAQLLKNENRKEMTDKTFKILSYYQYKDGGQYQDFSGEEKYKPYKGKKIRSIEIKIFKPFGYVEDDGSQEVSTKGQKFGNKIHFISKEWYVKRDILFHEGEKVQPALFADTEKLLWERRKFKDIRILLTEDKTTKEVDVLVYLQDNLSWVVGLGYKDRLIFGISTYNFFGLPNTLSVFAGINFNKYNLWAFGGAYKYENIKKSQINFTASFLIEKLNQNVLVSLNRNFFSIKTQWAFDVKYRYDYSTESLTGKSNDPSSFIHIKSNAYALWLAYALPFGKMLSLKDDKLKLIVAVKTDNIDYKRRPFLSRNTYDLIFINQQNYRVGIGAARWDYYLARNSFYIDVAEYFPKGYSASFWTGYQFDEVYGKRVSFDFRVNYGIHFKKFGYLYPQFNYTAFVRHKKGEEMISNIRLDYVSKSVALSKTVYFRQILKVDTKLGSNYPEERYFNMNEISGIRGFYSPFLKGSKSVTINAECDFLFDKKNILNTKAMTYLFCDMAWLSENKKAIFTKGIYQYGVGFGLRLRSTSIGLPYLDMQFSFYPRGKDFGETLFQFSAYGRNPNAILQNNMLIE